MFKPSHLTDEAANVLARARDERVYFIQSKRWIAYPKAVQILGLNRAGFAGGIVV